jgi:hypothetical protein
LSQGSRFAVGMAALVASLSIAVASNAYAAGSAGLTRIVSPTSNQVVGKPGVRVVLRSRASLSKLHVLINGHNVKRYFHQVGGQDRAELRLGRGLRPGVDELSVTTGGGTDFDSVTFIVARQDRKLLRLTGFRVGGPQTPVLVKAKLAPGSTMRAWVNGHRDDSAFHYRGGGLYVGRLGANDWLRAGRNRLALLASRTAPSKRSASYTVRSKTFRQERGRLTAGAGRDLVVNAGDFVRLDGTAANLGYKGAGDVKYRWQVTDRPRGVAPNLTAPASDGPWFEPKAPGTYLIAVKITAADGSTSIDTVTVTAREDLPPVGARLDTVADDRGTIMLDGKPVEGTTAPCDVPCASNASYAVFQRDTLELKPDGSGYVTKDSAGMTKLVGVATSFTGDALMVVNINGPLVPANARKLFDILGVARSSVSDAELTQSRAPYSVVGVPGAPPGSGYISRGPNTVPSARHLANMSGYLRLNPALPTNGAFEFVFADQAEFDTDASTVASQISMKVGSATYTHAAPVDGSSGLFLVRLNSQTLAPIDQLFYVTNKPDGSEVPAESKRLADDLGGAADAGGRTLVLLQAFNKPKGTSVGWMAAAAAIGRLGGTPQVFAQLNQKTADEPKEGRYALVGRPATDTGAAESSQALAGQKGDGVLGGLLGRDRETQYEPLAADPAGTINFALVRIVNRASQPGGGFPAFSPKEAAWAESLGRDVGICTSNVNVPCDVRKAYYQRMTGTDWSTYYTSLSNEKCLDAQTPPQPIKDCVSARNELQTEIKARNAVAAYFGRDGLQAAFGDAKVGALVDVNQIASTITQAVKPPTTSSAQSDAFELISHLVEIGGLAVGGAVGGELVDNAARGLSAAFGLASYLTRDDGSPDLVGPELTAKAADLGSILFKHYQAASNYFTTEAQIIMSDWSKMQEVADATPTDGWKLPPEATTTTQLSLATKQTIYQALVPVAYPLLINLGTNQSGYSFSDARSWKCKAPTPYPDKNLFRHTGPAAQLTWKVVPRNGYGSSAVIAVGRHAVGSGSDAYVPAPPDTVTGPLFGKTNLGGMGFYKLQFYSPQNFKLLPQVLQQEYEIHVLQAIGFGYYWCSHVPDPPDTSGG